MRYESGEMQGPQFGNLAFVVHPDGPFVTERGHLLTENSVFYILECKYFFFCLTVYDKALSLSLSLSLSLALSPPYNEQFFGAFTTKFLMCARIRVCMSGWPHVITR